MPTRKRKRNPTNKTAVIEGPPENKRQPGSQRQDVKALQVKHAVLNQYFIQLLTLRDYVLQELPTTSRIRRKRIASVGLVQSPEIEVSDIERSVGELLDSTLVGLTGQAKPAPDSSRLEKWASFTQKGDESYVTLSDGLAGAAYSQSDIVDFVIWQLFSRAKASRDRPEHVLCEGYRKDLNPARFRLQRGHPGHGIPGVYSVHVNPQVDALKQQPWPQLLKLLGKCGDRIMMDLLLDCATFTSLKGGQGNFRQISGCPLSKTKPLLVDSQPERLETAVKAPAELIFVRNRMLYARAALNARGLVHFGLRHIHILNRAPYMQPTTQLEAQSGGGEQLAAKNRASTFRVMMYIFPRQFGLHNAFTSKVDYKETAQRLKDYTLREQEILQRFPNLVEADQTPRLPTRLRGAVQDLVQKLQRLHTNCSYSKLLQHYCPVTGFSELKSSSQMNRKIVNKSTQSTVGQGIQAVHQEKPALNAVKVARASSLVELATPVAHVSAFCQAVVSKIIPRGFFGTDHVQKHNHGLLLKKVDRFIRLRRFESMSLHEAMQGMKITEIEWLAPSKLLTQKTSETDIRKRSELFYEFIYYLFDSILMPLLRSNFYVTESNTDKYRLFFFRHDVWRFVAEPAMSALKLKMFEEVNLDHASRILDTRQLGFSQVRLLPKGISVRPIMNLRKKMLKKGSRQELGLSINALLKPVHTVLQLEKSLNPGKLGSAMTSVGDIYNRIKTFKTHLGSSPGQLYFAKVDVQAAFDTIPQSAIVGLLDSIPQRRDYQIAKHVEIVNNNFSDSRNPNLSGKARRPLQKWLSTATKHRDTSALLESIETDRASKKRNTIFIEDVYKRDYDTSSLLQLVASHIQQNLVKIGKKYYRQKEGIPQGSILSSTLCNYFYADLEAQALSFLDSDDCLLLRLIDDFLLVTTDHAKASRFVDTMHAGVPEYGVAVSPAKTLVNFAQTINGIPVARLPANRVDFPYCGTLVNTSTLNITKDRRDRSAPATDDRSIPNQSIFNSLTVEYTRIPGQTFQRKVLNAFKIQSHLMYFDTSLNSAPVMLSNLYNAFIETATKTWAYARCLPAARRPAPGLLIRTIQKLADVALLLATSKARKARYPGYVCDVRKVEVTWLTYSAFAEVLQRKQSNYGLVLEWLHAEIRRLGAMKDIRTGRVTHVLQSCG